MDEAQIIELAGKLTDLGSDAWALRARVADVRGLQVGFQVCPEAYDALLSASVIPAQREAVAQFATFEQREGSHTVVNLVGFTARRDVLLHVGPAGRWTLALVLAPDPEATA